jgi:hypothetical protein
VSFSSINKINPLLDKASISRSQKKKKKKSTQVKKIDKRKEPALRQQAEEVQSNLTAFIEYRKSFV